MAAIDAQHRAVHRLQRSLETVPADHRRVLPRRETSHDDVRVDPRGAVAVGEGEELCQQLAQPDIENVEIADFPPERPFDLDYELPDALEASRTCCSRIGMDAARLARLGAGGRAEKPTELYEGTLRQVPGR